VRSGPTPRAQPDAGTRAFITPVTRDSASAAFFDGTGRGAFLIRRRRSSGEYLDPSTVTTPSDEADLEYVPASGGARVVSWSTVHTRNAVDDEPIRVVLGLLELDEGPWWWSQLVDVDPDGDLMDLRVHVDFAPSGPEPQHEVVPVFRPVQPSQPEDGSMQ
jgi:uncharacterized OB-fold protein